MKQFLLVFGFIAVVPSLSAQDSLLVTTGKTTSLIFPAAILHVDRGHASLLVQQVPAAGNLLQVKAAHPDMEATSLSVLTGDGRLFSFVVRFDPASPQLVYRPGNPIMVDSTMVGKTGLASAATMLLDNPPRQGSIKKTRWGMALQLKGIYSSGQVLFLHLSVANHSAIDYELDYLKLYIRDGRSGQRTAVQEKELHPLLSFGSYHQVSGHTRTSFVLALPRFTIPEAQYLALEMGERNGGRRLALKIRNHHLLKADPLSITLK